MQYDLRNMRVLMERLGNPQNAFRSVLIAGTNGKGSVAALLSAMMPEAGLYTSPHLSRLNERIRIGAEPISDADLKQVYDVVTIAAEDASADLLYPPTYFEMVTAMAFTYFRDRVTSAILEVGLGGRLDATNVVEQDVSVITSIGWDHQEFLGETLDQIASEKAGIIKDREPVVLGPEAELQPILSRSGSRLIRAREVERRSRSLGAGRFEVDVVTPVRSYKALRPRLLGRHQIDNVIVAIRTAECLGLSEESIHNGVCTAVWSGRLEVIQGEPGFLLDGAHNPNAVRALSAFLREFYPDGLCIIFGCMSDKNYREMLDELRPHARQLIFTKAQNSRSEDPAKLRKIAPEALTAPTIQDAIQSARSHCGANETVLICGSLYLIGEARDALL